MLCFAYSDDDQISLSGAAAGAVFSACEDSSVERMFAVFNVDFKPVGLWNISQGEFYEFFYLISWIF